jgi:hypothetical protein
MKTTSVDDRETTVVDPSPGIFNTIYNHLTQHSISTVLPKYHTASLGFYCMERFSLSL